MDNNDNITSILARYLLVVLLGLGNLFIFYWIFTNPTILASKLILSLFGDVAHIDTFIIFKHSVLDIAKACVAGSAYFLLFLLAMSVPIDLRKRIKLIAFCFGVFFIVNVLRIVFMGLILQTPLFNTLHLFLWNIFSTIFVILIWFSAVKIFKIKAIPFYTDFLSIKKSKKTKSHKKNE
jgi:exosortase/archaeosortase family protein